MKIQTLAIKVTHWNLTCAKLTFIYIRGLSHDSTRKHRDRVLETSLYIYIYIYKLLVTLTNSYANVVEYYILDQSSLLD